jgi:hypothetical protein
MPNSEKATPNPQNLDTSRIDKRVEQYLWIRDEIARIEETIKPLQELKDRLAGTMLEFLQQTGQKSAKTAVGTVTVHIQSHASCSDPDAFIQFVRANDAYELLDRRANALACVDYAESHGGTLPPGVKINRNRTVRVTRA